jgi:hypothetical protein
MNSTMGEEKIFCRVEIEYMEIISRWEYYCTERKISGILQYTLSVEKVSNGLVTVLTGKTACQGEQYRNLLVPTLCIAVYSLE